MTFGTIGMCFKCCVGIECAFIGAPIKVFDQIKTNLLDLFGDPMSNYSLLNCCIFHSIQRHIYISGGIFYIH